MQKLLVVILAAMLLPSAPGFAEESALTVTALSFGPTVTPSRSLQAAALRVLARVQTAQTPAAAPQKSWPARHPVWFGTLIGTGAGVGAASLNPYVPALAGIVYGAGISAVTGWVVSKVRD